MHSNRARSDTGYLTQNSSLDNENLSPIAVRRKLSPMWSTDSGNSLNLSFSSNNNAISSPGLETIQRPESTITNSSFSSLDSSGSSSIGSIIKTKPSLKSKL